MVRTELHQLRYVVQIAKHLNFSRAADDLCVTQPTLSHQILKLEEELGVSLFERRTRSVKPTVAGQRFIDQAEKVLADLECLRQSMQEYSSCVSGDIRIGVLPVAGSPNLTSFIPAFRKNYPGIRIRIIEAAGSHELMKLLLAGSIDVACLIPQPEQSYKVPIRFYPLISGRVVLVTAENHRFANRQHISLFEAADEMFILPPVTHSIYDVALSACRASGFEPKIACECGQLTTLLNLVAKGVGISFASSQLVEASLPAGICVIPFEPVIERTICLAALAVRHQPIISTFCDFMLKAVLTPAMRTEGEQQQEVGR